MSKNLDHKKRSYGVLGEKKVKNTLLEILWLSAEDELVMQINVKLQPAGLWKQS